MKHRGWIGFVLLGMLELAVSAEAARRPDWIEGASDRYPAEQYLIGVGYGDTRKAAEDAAYAAVARIFRAEIQSRTSEWEKYLQTDAKGETDTRREFGITQATTVSTDKLLENVRIAEVWRDEKVQRDYALAVMDRKQVSAGLREKIASLDLKIEELLKQARTSDNKLRIVRALHEAVGALLLRDAYSTELRIVGTGGTGALDLTQLGTVRRELDEYLRRNFRITVEVTGKNSDRLRAAVLEGLNQQGLPVSREPVPNADVVVKGSVDFQPAEMPSGKFVRWTAGFELTDPATGQVFGSVSRQGREGHLSLSEAEARAVRVAQKEVVEDLTGKIAQFIYGEEVK